MTRPVVLVGLGSIGMGYDLIDTHSIGVTTHARAVDLSSDFTLAAGVDPSAAAREQFTVAYGVPSFGSLVECAEAITAALVIIAAPDDQHLRLVREILDIGRPAGIWCEKPMGATSAEASLIVLACTNSEVPLWVNYIRRTDPGFVDAGRRLAEYSTKHSVEVSYSGDLRHVGCHFIDLAILWFGETIEVRPAPLGLGRGHLVSCELVMSSARVQLRQIRQGQPVTYSIRVDGSFGLMRYTEPAAAFGWIFTGEDLSCTVPTQLSRYQENALREVARALSGQESLLATGSDAVRVHNIIDRIEACE